MYIFVWKLDSLDSVLVAILRINTHTIYLITPLLFLSKSFIFFYLKPSNTSHLPLLFIIRLLLTLPRPTCLRLSASSYWPMKGRKNETEKKTRRKMKRRREEACPIRPSWSSRSCRWTEKCWKSSPPLTMKQVCVCVCLLYTKTHN